MFEPYVLLERGRRTGVVDGAAFPTHYRTRWAFTLRVASLGASASVRAILKASPDATNEDAWETKHDFGMISAEGDTVVRTFELDGVAAAFAWTEANLWMRLDIEEATGEHVVEALAEGRWLDLQEPEHEAELPGMVRTQKITRAKFVDDGERDVVRYLKQGRPGGRGDLALHTGNPTTPDLVRRAVAEQARWVAMRESLYASGEEPDRSEARRMAELTRDVSRILLPVIDLSGRVWRGR